MYSSVLIGAIVIIGSVLFLKPILKQLGALLNVVLDPIFIYALDFGVAGAVIATAISQIVSTVVYLLYIFRKKSVFSFRIRECCFSKEIMSEILKIGIPTLVFQILTSLSIAMINSAAKEYGSSALAAMGPVTKIMTVCMRPLKHLFFGQLYFVSSLVWLRLYFPRGLCRYSLRDIWK